MEDFFAEHDEHDKDEEILTIEETFKQRAGPKRA